MASPPATTVRSRRREPYLPITCPHCKAEIEYLKPPTSTPFAIQCISCASTFSSPSPPPPSSGRRTGAGGGGGMGGRRMGTDAKPLETEYYEVLGVQVDATAQEIKSAYRRLAIKLHPDKNLGDPDAGEKFKILAIAYNTLSDPVTRKKYNEMGSKKDAENDIIDPEAVFSTLFGGERFADIIGTISLGSEMKSALQSEEDEDPSTSTSPPNSAMTTDSKKPELSPEQKLAKQQKEAAASAKRAATREARVSKLAATLVRKLGVFTEQARDENDGEIKGVCKTMWEIEAQELKDESYGVELLQVVGHTYTAKSRHYLASTSTPFGLGGWLHSTKNSYTLISDTVTTLRAAMAVKAVFDELANAEKEGGPGLSEERRKELEEQAAVKGLKALFLGSKLEVESVVREVCDRILSVDDAGRELSRLDARKRAVALGLLGEVYSAVQKDPNAPDALGLDAGYVKVNSKNNKPPPSSSGTTNGTGAGAGGSGGRPSSSSTGSASGGPPGYQTYERRR